MCTFEIVQFLSKYSSQIIIRYFNDKKILFDKSKASSARVQYFWHFLTYCDVINVEHSSHGKEEEERRKKRQV